MGICTKINMVPMYVAMGFSRGVMPFISYNYSSGDHKRMRGALSFSIKIVEVMLVLSARGHVLLCRPAGARFYRGSGDRGIRRPVPAGILSGAAHFLALDFLCVGVFQAVGMGREALVLAILRKAVFEIPLLYLLNRFFPLYGLPYAQAVTECVMAAIAVGLVVRFLGRLKNELQRILLDVWKNPLYIYGE